MPSNHRIARRITALEALLAAEQQRADLELLREAAEASYIKIKAMVERYEPSYPLTPEEIEAHPMALAGISHDVRFARLMWGPIYSPSDRDCFYRWLRAYMEQRKEGKHAS
jgi:Ser/Thr protein kinase RdoA (MazF antagonist)